jgi:hypothetical protein
MIDKVLSRFQNPKKSGAGWQVTCPVHTDKKQSLHIEQKDDTILLHCHAGCETRDILMSVGLDFPDLYENSRPRKKRIVKTYDYHDAKGIVIYQSVRFEPKEFMQRRPDGKGDWIWNLKGVKPVPYRLPELLKAAGKQTILIVEGEKDVENLRELGFTATTSSGGAGKWRNDYRQYFKGARVVIIPDNDEPGRKHADSVARNLFGSAASIRIMDLGDIGVPEKGDISDYIKSGHTAGDIISIAKTLPEYQLGQTDKPVEADTGEGLKNAPFRVLGYNHNVYYYLSHESKQVVQLKPNEHSEPNLMALAPVQFWERNFSHEKGVDWKLVKNTLFRISHKTGIYDGQSIRGCGAWWDKGKIVVHNGDHLIVDGRVESVEDFKSSFIYEAALSREIGTNKAPLSINEGVEFLKLAETLQWESRLVSRFFAGWCVLAPICGALNWRPHVWLTGASGSGKAQPHSSKVLTVLGWRNIGELKVGDILKTPDDGYGTIKAIYPQGKRAIYKITFADGRTVRATADHLWKARVNTQWRLKTTSEIFKILDRETPSSRSVAIPLTCPIEIKSNRKIKLELLMHPYVLGALLGDGHFANIGERNPGSVTITTHDEYIISKIRKLSPSGTTFFNTNDINTYRFGTLARRSRQARALIKELKLLGTRSYNKFIPKQYLESSIEDRISLLQGLMDTDGTVSSGSLSYCTASEQLANDVAYLVRSLGGIAKISTKKTKYTHNGEKKTGRLAYNISIRLKDQTIAFSLPRKLELASVSNQYSECLYLNIKSIIFDGEEDSSCILIDHPERLYITDNFVVTHNTWVKDNIIDPLLGQHVLTIQGGTTEAGIRQALSGNAFPVIFDETEGENVKSQAIIQGILEIMRSSSSGSATIIKGGQSGDAQYYRIRSCFLLSSVGVSAHQRADTSRITILSILVDTRPDKVDRFRVLEKWVRKLITPEYAAAFRARAIKMIPVIRANCNVFAEAMSEHIGNRRFGDQTGSLIAGAYSLFSDKTIDYDEALAWINKETWSEKVDFDADSDERRCLNTILQTVLRGEGGRWERSIGELIETATLVKPVGEFPYDNEEIEEPMAHGLRRQEAIEVLARNGIKVHVQDRDGAVLEEKSVVFSNSHVGMQRILKDSPWSKNWGRILKRITNAEEKRERFGTTVTRAVVIKRKDLWDE